MTVFSDDTILAQFTQLIQHGDVSRARGCGYSFVTGKIFPSAPADESTQRIVVDWTSKAVNAWPGEEVFEICPGELVSLRTREVVTMPHAVCGIWNQTDALSRKGLLLVNLSAVPPGYEGHLTCTFANFGKQRVRIQPDTRIAKLMFLSLDRVAKIPSRPWATRDYDSNMATMASESPATFLQIADQSLALRELIVAGTAEIKNAGDQAAVSARQSLAADLTSAQADFQKSVAADTRNVLLKASPIVVIALGALALVQWFATNYLGNNVEVVAKLRADQIEARIDKQLEAARTKPVFVYSGTEESKVLLERIKALEDEIKTLEAKQK